MLRRESTPLHRDPDYERTLVDFWNRTFQAVLVVEDDQNDLTHLLSIMRGLANTTCTAITVSDAARQLAQHTFDLLLLDIHVGLQNGLSLVSALRERNPKTPAIVLSHDVASARDLLSSLGNPRLVRVLPKPPTTYSLLVTAAVLSDSTPTDNDFSLQPPHIAEAPSQAYAHSQQESDLVALLHSLRTGLRCSVAAVFAIDRRSDTVDLRAHSGSLSRRECSEDRFRLRYTPIKDAILRESEILAVPIQDGDARFAVYRETCLRRYSGFLGRRIIELDNRAYGLFLLFEEQPSVGTDVLRAGCYLAALACSLMLEQTSLQNALGAALRRANNWDRFRMGLHELSRDLEHAPLRADELVRAVGEGDDLRIPALTLALKESSASAMDSIRKMTSSSVENEENEEVDLNLFVAERLYAFLGHAQGSGDIEPSVRLTFVPCEVPACIRTNKRSLAVICDNILDNAIRWARRNGSRIPCVSAGVRPNKTTPGAFFIFVSDTGPGIHTRETSLIFQPYYTSRPDGTGLGLAIADQIAPSTRE